MRDHIRREAANTGASWWLVPVAFATAAVVAVATLDPDAQAQGPQAAPQPALAQPAAAQPGHPVPDVTEHVQAF